MLWWQNMHELQACYPFLRLVRYSVEQASYIILHTSIYHDLPLFSGAVEAGIAHGLKKRAAGLLPPQDTQSLLLKLTRLSEPAAELVKKLSGDDEANKDGSRNLSPGNYKIIRGRFSRGGFGG